MLEEAASREAGRVVCYVMPFTGGARALWRISVAPSRGHDGGTAIGEGADVFHALGRAA